MQLGIHLDGEEDRYLRVPTLWDGIENQWIGFVKTPVTMKLLRGNGKTSAELELSFNKCIKEAFESSKEMADEIFEMFKPMSHWEKEL